MKAKKFLNVAAAASDIASEEGRRKKATGFIYIRLSKSILFKQKAKKAFPLLAGKWGTNILSCFSRMPGQVKTLSQMLHDLCFLNQNKIAKQKRFPVSPKQLI